MPMQLKPLVCDLRFRTAEGTIVRCSRHDGNDALGANNFKLQKQYEVGNGIGAS
jgi:hypothetical protein